MKSTHALQGLITLLVLCALPAWGGGRTVPRVSVATAPNAQVGSTALRASAARFTREIVDAGPTAPPDAPGHTNVVPPTPAPGQTRAGQIYSIYVLGPTGDTIALTVFEPATVTGGKTYPLVLHSHGFGGSRATSTSSPPIVGNVLNGGNIGQLVSHGYGVISIDERGHGESTGTIRVMDPNYEGRDLLSVVDWAQVRLSWLAYGPSVDGTQPHTRCWERSAVLTAAGISS